MNSVISKTIGIYKHTYKHEKTNLVHLYKMRSDIASVRWQQLNQISIQEPVQFARKLYNSNSLDAKHHQYKYNSSGAVH